MKSVAVIGASLAGLSAARALRAQGFDGELTIVGGEVRRPYDRPPLSKEFLAGDIGADALALEAEDDDLSAQWLLGVHAVRLDAAAPHGTPGQRNYGPGRRRRRGHRCAGTLMARLQGASPVYMCCALLTTHWPCATNCALAHGSW